MASSMFAYLKSAVAAVATNVQQAAQAPIQIGERTVVIKEQLGEGGFAFVYSVEDASTGQPFALKRMLCQDSESRAIAEKEIRMMKLLKGHPHIIQYVASCSRETRANASHKAAEYFILMELCTGGSLIDLIKRRNGRKLGEAQVCDLFTQICRGVAHMHAQSPAIAHRDLKIENILINARSELRICDFGSCCTVAKAYTTQREIVEEEEIIGKYSTAMYRAPEMCEIATALASKRAVISEKVDIWSLGCILFALAFFTQPFQDGGNLQIISGTYEVPEGHPYSKYLTALMKRLLTVDPVTRPDIKQVLNLCEQWHNWLKSGGTATKPRAAPASTEAARALAPASAVTDPIRVKRAALEIPASRGPIVGEPHSAKPAKESKPKKLKRAPKHAVSAGGAPDDDWADFSAAPKAAPPAAASDSDSSSDDDAPTPSKPTNSRQTSSQQQATASLFDLSSFDTPAPAKPPASQPASAAPAASASNWASFGHAAGGGQHDDWAAFDSAPASAPAASHPISSTPASRSGVDSSAGGAAFDFDFSGLSATPAPAPATSKSPAPLSPTSVNSASSSASSSSSRKQRHHDHKSEAIDISRLAVSRASSHGEATDRMKLTIGKSPQHR